MSDKQYAIITVPADQKGEGLLGILLSKGLTGVTFTPDLRNHPAINAENIALPTGTVDGNNGLEAAGSQLIGSRRFFYVFDYDANSVGNIMHFIGTLGYASLYIGPIHQHPTVQGHLLRQQPIIHTQQPDDARLPVVLNNVNADRVIAKPENPSTPVAMPDSPPNPVKQEVVENEVPLRTPTTGATASKPRCVIRPGAMPIRKNSDVRNLPGSSRKNAIMIDDADEDVAVPTVPNEAARVKTEEGVQDGPNTNVAANDQGNQVLATGSQENQVPTAGSNEHDSQVVATGSRYYSARQYQVPTATVHLNMPYNQIFNTGLNDVPVDTTENQGMTADTEDNQVLDVESLEDSMDTTANNEPTTSGNNQIPQSHTDERSMDNEPALPNISGQSDNNNSLPGNLRVREGHIVKAVRFTGGCFVAPQRVVTPRAELPKGALRVPIPKPRTDRQQTPAAIPHGSVIMKRRKASPQDNIGTSAAHNAKRPCVLPREAPHGHLPRLVLEKTAAPCAVDAVKVANAFNKLNKAIAKEGCAGRKSLTPPKKKLNRKND